jgi:hypothetical protein
MIPVFSSVAPGSRERGRGRGRGRVRVRGSGRGRAGFNSSLQVKTLNVNSSVFKMFYLSDIVI